MKSSARDALALGIALAAAWLTHQFVLGIELVGWDAYPIIAASRVLDPGDAPALVLQEWMDGRYPRGHFYRPVTAFTFAIDHALWGLEPRGYQATNLACLLLAVASIFALARAWLGSAVAAGTAALVVAIHPAMLEVVPAAARRADLLALAFVAAALALQRFDGAPGRLRAGLGALCAALAVATKETGAVVVPVVIAAHALLPSASAKRFGTGEILRRAAPAVLAALAVLLARTAVLGGLGGHPDSSLLGGTLAGVLGAGTWVHLALMPQPWLEAPAIDFLLAAVLAGGLGVATWWAARRDDTARRLAWVLAVWAGTLLLLTGVSGDPASWYVAPLVAPYALLLGLILRASTRRWRSDRGSATAAAILVATLVCSHVARTDPAQDYPGWRTVSAAMQDFLAGFDTAIAAAAPGDVVKLGELPVGGAAPIERIGIRSALGLADYSLVAYAELSAPGQRIRVVSADAIVPATEGVVTIQVTVPSDWGPPQ